MNDEQIDLKWKVEVLIVLVVSLGGIILFLGIAAETAIIGWLGIVSMLVGPFVVINLGIKEYDRLEDNSKG